MLRLLLVCIVLLWASPIGAHSWYPYDCCSDNDCAPTDTVEYVPNPDITKRPLLVVTLHLTVNEDDTGQKVVKTFRIVVPDDFPKRQSEDNRFHACVNPYTQQLLCIFVPPAS